MKLFLLTCLAFVAVEKSTGMACDDGTSAAAPPRVTYSCEVKDRSHLVTFNGEQIHMTLPCKYNAIRRTVCGDYRVTITPGNEYDADLGKYVMKTIYIGVHNLMHRVDWRGKISVDIARKYLEGDMTEPFVKKDYGYMETADVFSCDYGSNHDYATLSEKNNQFKIDFRLDSDGEGFGFKFTCFSNSTSPSDYPMQICGNGMSSPPNVTTLLTNIFAMEDLIQVDTDCRSSARALQRCEKRGISIYSAIEKCGPILSDSSFYTTITKDNAYSVGNVFRHCVQFVCSKYRDLNACFGLKEQLSNSPTLPEVSDKFEEVCDQPLYPGSEC